MRFGYRDYDPQTGRFTAPDPIGDTGGDHDLYDYCIDDPVGCVDPTGLWTEEARAESAESPGAVANPSVGPAPKHRESPLREGDANRENGPARSRAQASQPDKAAAERSTPQKPEDLVQRPAFSNKSAVNPGEEQKNQDPPDKGDAKKTEAKKDSEAELTFMEAVSSGLGNLGPSAESFANDLVTAVKNPGQTLEGIGRVIAGYGCQIFGVESDFRAYSDAVTEYFSERYGSYENFKRTLAKDPVGLAGDISTLFTMGGGAVRGLAKTGTLAARVMPRGSAVARGVEGTAGVLGKAGAGMGKVGTVADPLNIMGKVGVKVIRHLPNGQSQWILPSRLEEMAKTATAFSRGRTAISVGGQYHSIKKNEEKQNP